MKVRVPVGGAVAEYDIKNIFQYHPKYNNWWLTTVTFYVMGLYEIHWLHTTSEDKLEYY